ncbi:MAG: hypothetical protein JWM81_669 [Candidatus Saccharibacteria bacterium]|nr:hypothetical protein [Candidatus Saccharibacteria bacterium]
MIHEGGPPISPEPSEPNLGDLGGSEALRLALEEGIARIAVEKELLLEQKPQPLTSVADRLSWLEKVHAAHSTLGFYYEMLDGLDQPS